LEEGFAGIGIKGVRSDQIVGNGRSRFAEHIGYNGIKGNVADGKGILETVFFAAVTGNQFGAVAGILPKDADFPRGDKTGANQTEPEQVTNPFGILDIILIAFDRFHPFGIGNGDIDTVFQKIENRDPVFTGRFHADIQAVIVKQPLFEAEDVIVKGRKAFFLVGGFNTPGGFDDCGNQKSLVDINTTTVLISNFDKNISFRKKTLTCGYQGEAIDCSATHLTGVKTILSVRTRSTTYLCLKGGTYTD